MLVLLVSGHGSETRFGELWNRKKETLRKKWDDMKDMSRGVEFRKSVLERMR